MNPTLCLIGGCNGAGKTTLARELLPLMGIRRFLNAEIIAYGRQQHSLRRRNF